MSEAATLDAPKRTKRVAGVKTAESLDAEAKGTDTEPLGLMPCVGMPVQYHSKHGDVLPGFVQRQSRTNQDCWDIKVSLPELQTMVLRTAVKFSSEPAPHCFTLLPGWGG